MAKPDPCVATWGTGKVFTPDLATLLWKIRVITVRIKSLGEFPMDFGGLWINMTTVAKWPI
jgi:hypothetical protein